MVTSSHKIGQSIVALLFVAMLGSVFSSSVHGQNWVDISQAEYGDKWPFRVKQGQLTCIPYSKVIFRAHGRVYAVNGMASGDRRFAEIRLIWRDDPKIRGLKINIGPIIDRGLTLCG